VIPLLMTLSLANQALSLSKLRKSMTPLREWWPYGPAPFILGGLFGVPVGLYLLVMLNPLALDEMIGFALVIYAIWMTFQKSRAILPARHTLLNSGVGFLGGVVGGLVAAPGPPLVVWATLAGLKKEAQRAIVQPFIIAMQVIAIAEYALKGPGLNTEFFLLALVMMPVVLLATQGGVWAFQKIPDQHFQKAVMILLALSGVSLRCAERLAGSLGIEWQTRSLSEADLASADEIMLTSTPNCILPASRFNGRCIGHGRPGATYRRLLSAWSEWVGLDIAGQSRSRAASGNGGG
jgi:uncharacterized membrane protein YfcA